MCKIAHKFKHHVFLLGADDPEMCMIADILKAHGLRTYYAHKNGKRVFPSEAYEADLPPLVGGDTLVLIECAPKNPPKHTVVIDHHRLGDPGYSLPPAQFWQAASIGQLITFLGLTPRKEHKLMAAMDHCYGAAIQGQCPGIEPEDILQAKLHSISARNNTPVDVLIKKLEHFKHVVAGADAVCIAGHNCKDLRHVDVGIGYSAAYLVLQLAVIKAGALALLHSRDAIEKPIRVTLFGLGPAPIFEAFMQSWAPKNNLVNIYGVPTRGYAGGYILL